MTGRRFITGKVAKYHYIMQYFQLIVGCAITALGFNLFLKPNQIASGGVAGISLLIGHISYIEPAITQWVGNIVLFFVGL